jgi:hypothetical protein
MKKICINVCYGGFNLSDKAVDRYAELKGLSLSKEDYGLYISYKDINGSKFIPDKINRDDPILIRVVEELGTKANGKFAKLEIVEIPNDVNWCIEEYDGNEWIAERHKTWS